ncbi:MAG TPA: aromatic amino acid ammonia-lyase [Gammaproteobacteria bacterium]|jgi:phenylalanine ammonia-lyase|nr:aromatic amino acid ammonia-lyase [Gammaproteobacteria bacterium]
MISSSMEHQTGRECREEIAENLFIGDHAKLTLADVRRVATQGVSVKLSSQAYQSMTCSYDYLKERMDQRLPVYGLNTNFGDQSGLIDPNLHCENSDLYLESISARQRNIVKSLSCGVGDVVSPAIVKVTMLLRAHCLAQGYSGIAPSMVESMIAFINADVIPVVRHYGSIGASGDLIPLSMIAAAMSGEDVDVLYGNETIKATEAIAKAGIRKLDLKMRDGLGLINGTSFMTAISGLALYDLRRLFNQMLTAVAMSLESMLVISSAYHPLVHQLKMQKGEQAINQFMLSFWEGSRLVSDLEDVRSANAAHHKAGAEATFTKPVQDCYSIRSVSQGFGPFHENLAQAVQWIENEMNSVNDNPIIDAAHDKIYHSANFMGYYVTDACDLLKMNIAQASTWLHALLANMVHARKSHQLPTNLVPNPAINNGFRSMQLLSAALAVQNRKLAQSQQAFSLPTEGDNQDVNSLGTHAAFDFQESVANLERLTAIMLLASAQALELRGIEKASKRAQAVFHTIRQYSPMLVACRPMTDELYRVIQVLRDEEI